MAKTRLEAFTDAIIAIVMTILVLEFEAPKEPTLTAILEMKFQFIIYLISFLTLTIYWINHHSIFQVVHHVSNGIVWLNTILILFMSLIPFTTSYVDIHVGARVPELIYGLVMLCTDIVWLFLTKLLVKEHGKNSDIKKAIADYKKSYITITLIIIGIIIGIFIPFITLVACILSLLPWIIPNKKIEKIMKNKL
ncbi:MAG: TMEM175 family protein [Clostridiales Family XIII bacterium]|jgi:uncharacterized membrane protein|nr:TMEM175 family protein [Clostridiales Family XIII bacterium]